MQQQLMGPFAEGIVKKMRENPIRPVFAYAVSGAGKTATALEIAKKNFTVYVDCNGGVGKIPQDDMLELLRFESVDISAWEKRIAAFFLARLIALGLARRKNRNLSPEDWLWLQVDKENLCLDLYRHCITLFNSSIDEGIRKLIKECPVLVILDEAQTLLEFGKDLWRTRSTNQPRPLGYGVVKYLIDFRMPVFAVGTRLRLKDFSGFHSRMGDPNQHPIVTAFPYLGCSSTKPLCAQNLNFIHAGSNTFLKHFLNISDEDCEEIAQLVAGRPRFSATVVEKVAEAEIANPGISVSAVQIARDYFHLMTKKDVEGTMYCSWKGRVEELKTLTNDWGVSCYTQILQLLHDLLFSGHSAHPFAHTNDFDLVSSGAAMVAMDDSEKLYVAEPIALTAALNYLTTFKPTHLLNRILTVCNDAADQSSRGKHLELLVALSLLINPNTLGNLVNHTFPKATTIRSGIRLSPKLLESTPEDSLFICLPENAAGPDIVMCDRKFFVEITMKTTTDEKLTAEATRNNQERNDPASLYTSKNGGGSGYRPGEVYWKLAKEWKDYLAEKKYTIVRVCIDYPVGAPSVKWTAGAKSENGVWKVCIDESNVRELVGDDAAEMIAGIHRKARSQQSSK
jgi:hypothetical protein